MWFSIVIASAVSFGIAGFLMKFGAHRFYSIPHILLGLYITGSLGFLISGIIGYNFEINYILILAGIIVGTGSTAGNILFMKALRFGPVSLTSPVVNMNIVMVVIMSVLFYNESLGGKELAGIGLIIIFVSLLPVDPNEKISIHDRRWYGIVLVAVILFFFRNGGLKITDELGLNNTMVLLYGYLLSVVWSWVLTLRSGSMTLLKVKPEAKKMGFICGLTAGIFSFGGMQLYTLALSNGPASIVSPVFASNSLITGILAIIFLRERLSPLQIFAVIGILSGIIILRM